MVLSHCAMNGLYDALYFDLDSEIVHDKFRIFVGTPSSMAVDTLYPTIFALDGNVSFPSLLGTQRLLTQGAEVPPSFVVGIGYPGDTLAQAMANRNRDYIPSAPGEAESRALGQVSQVGGPAFLRFIEEELKPLLAQEFPVDLEDSTLQGTSLGGLFASWVLLTNPQAFRKYILCSPAIWWRDEEVWEWEESYHGDNSDLPATVFIGAGELETDQHLRADAAAIAEKNPAMAALIKNVIHWNDENGWPEVAKLTPRFAERLAARNYPGLTIHCHNMPDENHMSASPALSSRGLRYVNASWVP